MLIAKPARVSKPKILVEMTSLLPEIRMYQIWERNPLRVDLFLPKVFYQKIDYVHFNPVKAGLCARPEDYFYSYEILCNWCR
jgi:hypothetical protein